MTRIRGWQSTFVHPHAHGPWPPIADGSHELPKNCFSMFVRIHSGPSCLPVPPKKISTKKIFFICLLSSGKSLFFEFKKLSVQTQGTCLVLTLKNCLESMGLNTIQVNVSEVPIKIKIGLFPWTICSAILYIHCIQRESVTRKNMAFYYLRCC